MNIEFVASVAVISPDPDASRRLYIDALGLPLRHGEGDDYEHSEDIAGTKHVARARRRRDLLRPVAAQLSAVSAWRAPSGPASASS